METLQANTMATNNKVAFPCRFPGRCVKCGLTFPTGTLVRHRRNQGDKGVIWHDTCDSLPLPPEFTPVPPVQPLAPIAPIAPQVPSVTSIESPAKPTSAHAEAGLFGMMAEAIAPYLEQRVKGLVDESAVVTIVERLFQGMTFRSVQTVEVHNQDTGESRDMGLQHHLFPLLLRCIGARKHDGHHLNIWLTGPTGSGKTTSAKYAAQALDMRFGFCGAMDTSFQLLGYNDAHGQVVKTEFRDFFTNGGVFLLDEVDSWSPSALLALNAALANGECAFPDGTFPRSPDFVCIAAANTWGLGATNEYVGRCKLDAAFLARFACKLDWTYDETLERALCPNPTWANRVIQLRANAKRQGLKVIIHPRYTYEGAALLATGLAQDQVEAITIKAGLSDDQWKGIQ